MCGLCDEAVACYNFCMKKIFLAFSNAQDTTTAPMSPARAERYEQLKNPEIRKQYLASSRAIDAALSALTGDNDRSLTFVYDESGAPKVAGACISPAHTSFIAGCAAADVPVGLDIERRDRQLSESMIRKIGNIDHFLALEACVKMTGEGLAAGIGSYKLHEDEIYDRNGNHAAYAVFLDHDVYRVCVCCREKFEIVIV